MVFLQRDKKKHNAFHMKKELHGLTLTDLLKSHYTYVH